MKLQITIDGKVYAVDVELVEEEESTAPASPLPPPPQPLPPLHAANFAAEIADSNLCCSPVTGLVIRVAVEPGQSVESGAPLLVLEAMKMETQVTAPRAATIKAVHVKPGDPVKLNQPLVEFA